MPAAMFTVIRTRNSADKLALHLADGEGAAARAGAIEIFRVPRRAGAGARETATREVGRPAETRLAGDPMDPDREIPTQTKWNAKAAELENGGFQVQA